MHYPAGRAGSIMTDFKKWDKFDADAAEEEVERKVSRVE